MIQEEFKDIVFKFARHASTDEVAYIFLFGSVAKGDADRRSDIDILIVLDTDKQDLDEIETKTRVSELALTLEREFDRNIQVIFTNRRFEGLDAHFIEEVLKEGILLFAKYPSITFQGLELDHYILVTFTLDSLSVKDKMKVKRTLYGLKTTKKVKGTVYKYEDAGLVRNLDGLRIGAGAIAIPKKNEQTIDEALRKLSMSFRKIDLWLTKDSVRKLQAMREWDLLQKKR